MSSSTVCTYFTTPQGCRFGASCRFLHTVDQSLFDYRNAECKANEIQNRVLGLFQHPCKAAFRTTPSADWIILVLLRDDRFQHHVAAAQQQTKDIPRVGSLRQRTIYTDAGHKHCNRCEKAPGKRPCTDTVHCRYLHPGEVCAHMVPYEVDCQSHLLCLFLKELLQKEPLPPQDLQCDLETLVCNNPAVAPGFFFQPGETLTQYLHRMSIK
eukprot:PhF_6_TR38021/c0_g1_i1/m.56755